MRQSRFEMDSNVAYTEVAEGIKLKFLSTLVETLGIWYWRRLIVNHRTFVLVVLSEAGCSMVNGGHGKQTLGPEVVVLRSESFRATRSLE